MFLRNVKSGAFSLFTDNDLDLALVRYRLSIASSTASRFEPRPEAKTPIGTIRLRPFRVHASLAGAIVRIDSTSFWNPFRLLPKNPVFFLVLVEPDGLVPLRLSLARSCSEAYVASMVESPAISQLNTRHFFSILALAGVECGPWPLALEAGPL